MACKTSGGDSSILAPAGWAGEGLISLVVTDRDERQVCGGSDGVDGRPSGVFVVVFKLDSMFRQCRYWVCLLEKAKVPK